MAETPLGTQARGVLAQKIQAVPLLVCIKMKNSFFVLLEIARSRLCMTDIFLIIQAVHFVRLV